MIELLETPEDIQWLKDVHFKGIKYQPFERATISGNSDCPDTITTFIGFKVVELFILNDDLTYKKV